MCPLLIGPSPVNESVQPVGVAMALVTVGAVAVLTNCWRNASNPVFRVVATPSAVYDLLCMRRLSREKSVMYPHTRAERFAPPKDSGES